MSKPHAEDSKSAVRARVAQWAEASEKLNHERDINLAKSCETQSLVVFDGMLPLAIAAQNPNAGVTVPGVGVVGAAVPPRSGRGRGRGRGKKN